MSGKASLDQNDAYRLLQYERRAGTSSGNCPRWDRTAILSPFACDLSTKEREHSKAEPCDSPIPLSPRRRFGLTCVRFVDVDTKERTVTRGDLGFTGPKDRAKESIPPRRLPSTRRRRCFALPGFGGPCISKDQPRLSFRERPAKGTRFQRARVLSTVRKRRTSAFAK